LGQVSVSIGFYFVTKVDVKISSDLFISIDSEINRFVTDGCKLQNIEFTTDLIRALLLGGELLNSNLPRYRRAPRGTTGCGLGTLLRQTICMEILISSKIRGVSLEFTAYRRTGTAQA